MYFHSGTSHGAATNIWEHEAEGYPQRSFFKDLEESGVSWGVFFEDFPVTLDLRDTRAYPDRFHFMDDFIFRAKVGDLPEYSFLEPRWGDEKVWSASTQHPDHSFLQGELLLKEVYDALRNGPLWEDTIFVVNYDEHGGLFDHVPTPDDGSVPNPDGLVSQDRCCLFNFTRLGLRIPFVLASPYVSKGAVYGEPSASHFEHSSAIKTFRKWLNVSIARPLTRREEWAAPFDHAIDLVAPRRDALRTLPTAASPSQMAAYRRARALPEHKLTERQISRLPDHPDAGKPLSDLQMEVCTIAALALDNERIPLRDLKAWTQKDMARYLRRQVRRFKGGRN